MLSKQIPERVLPLEDARKALDLILKNGGKSWFLDIESSSTLALLGIRQEVFSLTTRYQKLDVFHAEGYGLCMILDGRVQLAQSDERIYHELLVHPACILHGSPRRAIVLGGGDGCAVRELLKYKSIEEITLVDIDEEVVNLFRDRFQEINEGALKDPRVKVVCKDALDYLKHQERPYDLIFSDLTEPFDTSHLAGELSFHLYTPPFYRLIREKLTPDGIFVCQTGGVLYQPSHDRFHLDLIMEIREHFPHVATCYEFVPSFSELWSITLAADRPLHITRSQVDEAIDRMGLSQLFYYDGMSHERAFKIPLYIRNALGLRNADQ